MSVEVAELGEDLRTKFDELCTLHDMPELFVDDLFSQLRQEIDYDAERALCSPEIARDTLGATKLNSLRGRFLEFVEAIKRGILENLSVRTRSSSTEELDELRKKVYEFEMTKADLEDVYEQLAGEMIDRRNKAVKEILGNQSIFYIPSNNEADIGNLVHFAEDCLNWAEISSIR